MNATYALTLASTKMLFRNWSSLIFTFMLPMLILFGAGFLSQGGAPRIGVGVVAAHPGAATTRLIAGLHGSQALLVRQGSLEQLKADLAAGKLALVVQLPDRLESTVGPDSSAVRVYTNAAQAAMSELASAVLARQIQLALPAAGNGAVAYLDQRPVESKEVRYIKFLLPGIIGLGIMQMCIFSVAPVFVFYRERGILKRLLSTPMKPYQFIISNSAARLLVACLQAAAFLAVGAFVFDSSPNGSYTALALCILMGAVMFLGLGFSLAGIASSVESAPVLANLATFPMVFFGGTFFPLTSMPHWLQDFASALPLTHFSAALRAIINDGAGLAAVQDHLLVIAAWAATFILIAVYTFRARFARAA